MKAYLDIVKKVLEEGSVEKNRTGVNAVTMSGAIFEHDMYDGFPLITTKKIPFRLVASELEFFIRGLTDKKWLQERGNHIWDEWCTPIKVPYGHAAETRQKMKEERDLGPIYGFQWRHFGADYEGYDKDYTGKGIDQFTNLINTLKENPHDRRILVTSWNPEYIDKMALPPCHYGFQATVTGDKLNLIWTQRSVDVMLGLPFNIASYATLLHLIAKEVGLKEGKLTGSLGDTHIYVNHIEGAKEQLSREPYELPKIETNFTSIFDWKYTDTSITGYNHHSPIKFEIAV